MTNEEIIVCIKNGNGQKDYLQMLYDNNLPAIKAICRKYASYAEMEDLLQESFFGLIEAVNHYDSFCEVKFWTYAVWWIRQAVFRYVENCGSCLRIPEYLQQDIIKYKRCISDYECMNGKTPSEEEIAEIMKISVKKVREIECYIEPLASLDCPIGEDAENTLCDVIESEINVENEVVNKMLDDIAKDEIWAVLERTVDDTEKHVIQEYYVKNKTLTKIADEMGTNASKIRYIKNSGLRKMGSARIKRELSEKLECFYPRIYRTGLKPFEISFTSSVEDIVIQRDDLNKKYDKMQSILQE